MYRKHFTVDASLEGKLLSLLFDGVYRNSDMWLNGVFLGHHTSGYTSFRWFIHNLTSPDAPGKPVIVYGGDNVLAVRVDALSAQEGWFYELRISFKRVREGLRSQDSTTDTMPTLLPTCYPISLPPPLQRRWNQPPRPPGGGRSAQHRAVGRVLPVGHHG